MLGVFKPTWMVESIYYISPEQLKNLGIKVVLTDLDNTLIAWDNPEATEETMEWIHWMEAEGIRVVIISNNKESRVRKVASILDIEFISCALKPTKHGFKKAMKLYDHDKNEMLMVGDQMLTDIWGANCSDIKNVLVKPIMNSDAWNTRLNRFIELRIMNRLIEKDPDMKWSRSLDEPIE